MTSDLLVNGVGWDVYSPEAGTSVRNIITNTAKKFTQVHGGGVVVDLSKTGFTPADFGNILARVNGMIKSWGKGEFLSGVEFFGWH